MQDKERAKQHLEGFKMAKDIKIKRFKKTDRISWTEPDEFKVKANFCKIEDIEYPPLREFLLQFT